MEFAPWSYTEWTMNLKIEATYIESLYERLWLVKWVTVEKNGRKQVRGRWMKDEE
jgi:hypothetical protein